MHKKQKRVQTKTIQGVISINSRGVGFVADENGKDDIEIPTENLNCALNKDEVEVRLTGGKSQRKRLLGAVMKIVKRAKDKFVGVLKQAPASHKATQDTEFFVKPDD